MLPLTLKLIAVYACVLAGCCWWNKFYESFLKSRTLKGYGKMIREIARKTDRMQVHKKYKNIVMFLT